MKMLRSENNGVVHPIESHANLLERIRRNKRERERKHGSVARNISQRPDLFYRSPGFDDHSSAGDSIGMHVPETAEEILANLGFCPCEEPTIPERFRNSIISRFALSPPDDRRDLDPRLFRFLSGEFNQIPWTFRADGSSMAATIFIKNMNLKGCKKRLSLLAFLLILNDVRRKKSRDLRSSEKWNLVKNSLNQLSSKMIHDEGTEPRIPEVIAQDSKEEALTNDVISDPNLDVHEEAELSPPSSIENENMFIIAEGECACVQSRESSCSQEYYEFPDSSSIEITVHWATSNDHGDESEDILRVVLNDDYIDNDNENELEHGDLEFVHFRSRSEATNEILMTEKADDLLIDAEKAEDLYELEKRETEYRNHFDIIAEEEEEAREEIVSISVQCNGNERNGAKLSENVNHFSDNPKAYFSCYRLYKEENGRFFCCVTREMEVNHLKDERKIAFENVCISCLATPPLLTIDSGIEWQTEDDDGFYLSEVRFIESPLDTNLLSRDGKRTKRENEGNISNERSYGNTIDINACSCRKVDSFLKDKPENSVSFTDFEHSDEIGKLEHSNKSHYGIVFTLKKFLEEMHNLGEDESACRRESIRAEQEAEQELRHMEEMLAEKDCWITSLQDKVNFLEKRHELQETQYRENLKKTKDELEKSLKDNETETRHLRSQLEKAEENFAEIMETMETWFRDTETALVERFSQEVKEISERQVEEHRRERVFLQLQIEAQRRKIAFFQEKFNQS